MIILTKLSAVLASIVFITSILSSPADARTMEGVFINGATERTEGSYHWFDCNAWNPPCNGVPDDGDLWVQNVDNGYGIGVKFHAYINGRWAKYLDRFLSDGKSAK